MTRYPKTQATSKIGINHVKGIIKQALCSFHTIHQENDIGIDAIIELFHKGKSTGRLLCIQVKSGDSFYNLNKNICKIPIDSHRDYWSNHNLPVFGIVYVPYLLNAYVIDIKKYLLRNKDAKNISFAASELNQLDFEKLDKILKGELNLFVSYENEFEKFTNGIDYYQYRFLINFGSVSLKNLIKGILSSEDIHECLRFVNYKLIEIKETDVIAPNDIMRTICTPNIGKVVFGKNNEIFVEQRGFELYESTFPLLKTHLIEASIF